MFITHIRFPIWISFRLDLFYCYIPYIIYLNLELLYLLQELFLAFLHSSAYFGQMSLIGFPKLKFLSICYKFQWACIILYKYQSYPTYISLVMKLKNSMLNLINLKDFITCCVDAQIEYWLIVHKWILCLCYSYSTTTIHFVCFFPNHLLCDFSQSGSVFMGSHIELSNIEQKIHNPLMILYFWIFNSTFSFIMNFTIFDTISLDFRWL